MELWYSDTPPQSDSEEVRLIAGSRMNLRSLLKIFRGNDDDDCFYYHSWRNNVVIVFGTLSSFLT